MGNEFIKSERESEKRMGESMSDMQLQIQDKSNEGAKEQSKEISTTFIKEEKVEKKTLAAQEDGTLVGSSFEEQFRLARAYHASGLMPKGLNSPEKVLVAMQLCRELGLPPMTSIGKICVINGTASLFGDLPLALVMKSGLIESIKEEQTIEGAVCTVKRKGMESLCRSFSLVDAKQADLLGKGPWKQYTKRMLQMRARTWALKDAFPDILGGIFVSEYDANAYVTTSGEVVGESKNNLASELNETFLEESKTQSESQAS
jgi:hypothetical protein